MNVTQRPSPRLVVITLAAALLCAHAVAAAPSAGAQAAAKTAAPGLTRAALRATNPAIGDAAFNAKWKAALESPLLFIRSFPAGYHASLKGVTPPLGAEGLCVGDAHPANFGFLLLGGKTRFGYNDLDDSGDCPVAWDALRYFIALKLATGDDGLVKDIVERYVDVVKDASRASGVPKNLEPDWGKVAKKGLDEASKGDKIVGAEVTAATAGERSAIVAALKGDARTKNLTVLDVAAIARESGGSGGLARFWVLAQAGQARTLLELKEATRPGVEWGRHTKSLSAGQRLGTLKAAFWGAEYPNDWYGLTIGKTNFLVRDRLQKKSLDVIELGKKDQKDVLQAQASELARIHRAAWSSVKKDDLRAFLLDYGDALGKTWKDAYAAARR
ncbi:MAG: DUF2252 family protein [Deltaproteobacteria bacterium]|nr:DUF2252 family protein [Deltaproteobacteria bacterium]